MRKYGFRDRARYRFDNFMARGTSAQILALAGLSLVFVLIGGGGDEGWGFRAIMLIVTIAGIFIFSALLGVLAAILADMDKVEMEAQIAARVGEGDGIVLLAAVPQRRRFQRRLTPSRNSVRCPDDDSVLNATSDASAFPVDTSISRVFVSHNALPDLGKRRVVDRTR
jgi:hypothetical protein